MRIILSFILMCQGEFCSFEQKVTFSNYSVTRVNTLLILPLIIAEADFFLGSYIPQDVDML